MEKIKQQFGVLTVDGEERNYCNISLEIGNDEGISKVSLSEQFKLFAENFWIYLQGQKEARINRSLLDFDSNNDSFSKGWSK